MKNIVLLGATGSIGDSCLNVIRQNKKHFSLFGIGLGSNLDKAQQIAKEFSPEHIFVAESHIDKSHDLLQSYPNILYTEDELQELIQDPCVDIVISAISGFAGLKTSYFAIDAGKTILIANKESIVAAGDILMPLAKIRNSEIIPVDSEHNAIHQCLPLQRNLNEISKIMITASGGPFREKAFKELSSVTLEDALNHPTWTMGTKITIDSATLVNKCLELIMFGARDSVTSARAMIGQSTDTPRTPSTVLRQVLLPSRMISTFSVFLLSDGSDFDRAKL